MVKDYNKPRPIGFGMFEEKYDQVSELAVIEDLHSLGFLDILVNYERDDPRHFQITAIHKDETYNHLLFGAIGRDQMYQYIQKAGYIFRLPAHGANSWSGNYKVGSVSRSIEMTYNDKKSKDPGTIEIAGVKMNEQEFFPYTRYIFVVKEGDPDLLTRDCKKRKVREARNIVEELKRRIKTAEYERDKAVDNLNRAFDQLGPAEDRYEEMVRKYGKQE